MKELPIYDVTRLLNNANDDTVSLIYDLPAYVVDAMSVLVMGQLKHYITDSILPTKKQQTRNIIRLTEEQQTDVQTENEAALFLE